MANSRPDFVQVRLTARGQEIAGDAPLGIANGRRNFEFKGSTAQEAEKSYEWNAFLRLAHDGKGEPLFELVPDAPAAKASAPAPATTAAVTEDKK